MNMMALRSGGDIIVIDCGILFPGAELLGVDVITPDLSYLLEHRDEIRALILTHGHEDHVGAVPYFLSQLSVPVYSSSFTWALVKRRLDEHRLDEAPVHHAVEAGDRIPLGCFGVEFIHVTHSTVECFSLAIESPAGVIIHTADFKIDQTPVDDRRCDLHAFARYGEKGVALLLADSTNVDRPGYTPSEREVRPALDEIFTRAEGSIFLSCFSSATHRVQQFVDLCAEHDRKLAMIGRSLTTASEIAHERGLLHIPDGILIRPQDLQKIPRDQRTVIVAGSQGEPLSSMSRASVGQHKQAVIKEGDDVVLSARVIPGNEKAIYRMIDHLCLRGATVHYGDQTPPLHVSGHAAREELKLIHTLVRPRFFVPVHGEYRQLSLHAKLARDVCADDLEAAFILQSGETLVLDEEGARRGEDVEVGRVFIDAGTGDEIVEEMVIRDRRNLSEFGVIIPILAVDRRTGKIATGPEIVSRGFVVGEESEELIEGARAVVVKTVEGSSREEVGDPGVLEEKIRTDLRRYLARKTSRSSRPLIAPVLLES